MPNSYGLIVEGDYDHGVFEEFIRKAVGSDPLIVPRPCDGVTNLKRDFPALLRDLEHVLAGRPVDKALVIRDAGGKDHIAAETELSEKIRGRDYCFPDGIKFHAVRQHMDTLLLADIAAINRVARSRNPAARPAPPVNEALEDMVRPKERLKTVLSSVGLPHTAQVCREIAREADINTVSYRCRSFQTLIEKIRDC